MTSEQKDKIIDLISKMSALTATDSGAFQGEISNASAKIQELMDKYSITWAEVHGKMADKQSKEFEDAFTTQNSDYVHKKVLKWHWKLARIIARVTHTKYYVTRDTTMVFFGTTENASIASSLYTLWVANITKMAKDACEVHRKNMVEEYGNRPKFWTSLPKELQWRYYFNSWIDGCLDGMNSNVYEQEQHREKEVEKAIVLYTRKVEEEWDNFTESMRFKKVNTAGNGSSVFSNAGYTSGKTTGSSIKIGSKGVPTGGRKMLGGG